MLRRSFASIEEKTTLFHSELVKVGVPFDLARQAARLLASPPDDEQLTNREKYLLDVVCRVWLRSRQRVNTVDTTVRKVKSASSVGACLAVPTSLQIGDCPRCQE